MVPVAASGPTVVPPVSMIVSPAGDIALLLGKKRVGDGRWDLFQDTSVPADADELRPVYPNTTALQDSPVHAVITGKSDDSVARWEITLAGEDLRILLHLQNLTANKTVKHVNLQGLTFHFAHPAEGTVPSWHWTYLKSHGTAIYYPSVEQPTGGVYVRDEHLGVGMHSSTEFGRQLLFNAIFVKDGIIPADPVVQLFTTRQVPPGGSVDVDANFRISDNTAMPHLLGAYKACYDAHFPGIFYHPDNRPVAAWNGAGESKTVTRSNPFGFLAPIRRLDSSAGVNAYVRLVAPVLQQAHALGVIFWSPGGYQPPMYPPDFDVFPDAVQQNIPALVDGFHTRGLRVGLCARCGDGITREPGKDPVLYRLSATNAGDMQTMLARFHHAMAMGFDLFYLDSIGTDGLNDADILKQVRDSVGPNVLLYSELSTDLTLPYAGRYSEWRGDSLTLTSFQQYQVMKFLCPDSTWICIAKQGPTIPRAYASMGLVPLVQDMQSNRIPISRAGR